MLLARPVELLESRLDVKGITNDVPERMTTPKMERMMQQPAEGETKEGRRGRKGQLCRSLLLFLSSPRVTNATSGTHLEELIPRA